jgi:hypothetical protein
MSTGYNVGNKTSYCRVIYGKHLNSCGYKITHIHHDCRGCHAPSEFKTCPHITKWEKKNKSCINLLEIRDSIRRALIEESGKVKNPKYKSGIIYASSLPFNDLLHFWFDITCYHRKIAKTLKTQKPCEGYSLPKDVPKFYLPNEDDVWGLERVIHYCQNFKHMIDQKGNSFHVRDICVGHKNCKHGVHDLKDLVCVDNLIKGTCSCGPNIYEESRDRILSEIEVLKKKMAGGVDEDGFEITITKTMKAKFISQITALQKELGGLKPRKIHYTEQGIIPLSKRIEDAEASKPKEIDVEEIKTKTVRRIKKKGK